MKAKVRTDALGNITVHMEGGLDYENYGFFKKELQEMVKKNPSSTITLDLHKLDFVGSSGIGLFVDTLKIMNEKRDAIKLMNVKTEFLKVFKLYGYDAFETLIHEFENDDTEDLSQRFGARRRTFQN